MSSNNWKNVNNWHWVENDCQKLAHSYFKGLEGRPISQNVSFEKFMSLSGDVVVNIRKGKTMPLYDFHLSFSILRDGVSENIDLGLDSLDKEELISQLRQRKLADMSSILSSDFENFLVEGFDTSIKSSISKSSNLNQNPSLEHNCIQVLHSKACFDWIASCSEDMISSFLVGDIRKSWPNSTVNNNVYSIENGLIIYELKDIDRGIINLNWKLKDWNHFSKVIITFSSFQNGVKINLSQSEISNDFIDSAKVNWERYFWRPFTINFGINVY